MNNLLKKYLFLTSVATGVLISSLAMAAVTSNVANTKHNFSITGTSSVFTARADSGMTQVCVFCHTPHNAGQTRLLWNKATNGNTSFRLYTSSGSLTNVVRNNSSLPAGSPSLLCLGCHDGKTAMNILHTASSPTAVDPASVGAIGYPVGSKLIPVSNGNANPLIMPDPVVDIFTGTSTPAMNIGGSATGQDLTNDHPIGFSYSDVLADVSETGLHTLTDAKNAGIRFFDSAAGKDRVECSSCHDPHVDVTTDPTYWPFLVKSNTGSGLCLACHNK